MFPVPMLCVLLLAALATLSSRAAEPEGIFYRTGFEAAEPVSFVVGGLQGQNGWTVLEGNAVVQSTIKARGGQAVQSGQATFKFGLNTAAPVLWVDAFVLDSGSTNQPMVPNQPATSLLVLSANNGILACDGDGAGHGYFVQVTPSWNTNEFIRITVRQDYINKTYDVWINGSPSRRGLRFKNNVGFTGVQRRSNSTSYLDDFSVTTWGLDADSDGDGLIDLDEIKFHSSDPLKSDTDGDGVSDGQEVLAGTLPSDSSSHFALRIDQAGPDHYRIRIPTVTGRQYTLQRRLTVSAGDWNNVEGAVGVAGDGTEQIVMRAIDGTNYFYRGVVNP